ncbi:hypothetical protein BOX15_Mlig016571g1 [Macrostomum lignano]|uniref:RyR/IP3R Homology associated domain-containing protein n=3 Tax=Macrostomum lignano TaxID=282301 RepID=A0A267DVH0_9PLAT|nr:hypothetical protein BOX15_Mlig016571g1 [Macrostomum lignano]
MHGSKEDYVRKAIDKETGSSNSMAGLVWSQAPLKKVGIVQEMQFDDAFTIYAVEEDLVNIFNYAAGAVPFVQKLCHERKQQPDAVHLNAYRCHLIVTALGELRDFMIVNSEPVKKRQKLLRNLRIVELLVRLLQTPFRGAADQQYLVKIFVECYEVLYTYLMGDCRKNELYIAKHIDFFRSQIVLETSSDCEEVGLSAAHMIKELIMDNRKIVDRIPTSYIDEIMELLKQNRNFRYIELLSILCVCDGLSMPENQNYITEKWLVEGKNFCLVFFTDLGQEVGKEKDKVFVSTDNRRRWTSLANFAKDYQSAVASSKLNSDGSVQITHVKSRKKKRNARKLSPEEQNATIIQDFLFLEHQLDLFGKLCQGRNAKSIEVITKRLNYLTWNEAFICLTDEELPDQLRAKYCELITTMFVDVDDNISVLDKIDLTFVYDDIAKRSKEQQATQLVEIDTSRKASTQRYFPALRDWLEGFLDQNHDMTASEVGHNILLAHVMQMLHYLVRFGYYNSTTDIKKLLKPLLDLLDGRNDKPLPKAVTADYDKVLQHYRTGDRFKQSRETKAVVDAKYEAMRVLDLLFNFRFNVRLRRFVAEFKEIHQLAQSTSSSTQDALTALLSETYELNESVDSVACQRLAGILSESAYFKDFDIVQVLLDLSNYDYPKMVQMSMWLINRYHSAYNLLFKRAVLAQVLITDRSVAVHKMVEEESHVMRRLIGSKMTKADVEKMCAILTKFCKVCHLDDEPEERHPMNQAILYNHGILNEIFDLVSQDVDINLLDEYSGLRKVFAKCFSLLRLMARGNAVVQNHLFDRLDALLSCVGAESELALALAEVFTGNKNTCMKVLPHQIARAMALVAQHGSKAPEFLDMLNALVKVEELDLPLKRNQAYVMKYFMQHRADVAQCLDQPKEAQFKLLRSASQSPESDYMIALVDLLATCAEGENRFIESINQTIYKVSDVLAILTDPAIPNHNKRPFARFLLWVYLNTAGGLIESGAGDLPHDANMWQLFGMVREDLSRMAELAVESPQLVRQLLKVRVLKKQNSIPKSAKGSKEETNVEAPQQVSSGSSNANISDGTVHGTLKFLFEGGLPIMNVFFKNIFLKDLEEYPMEIDEINKLVSVLMTFVDAIMPLASDEKYVKTLLGCTTTLFTVSTLPTKAMEEFQSKYGSAMQFNWDARTEGRKQYEEYYSTEEELNAQLNVFALNYSIAYGGENTLRVQIGFPSDLEYTEIGSDEELPLGKEFQNHMNCFIDTDRPVSDPLKFQLAGKLVEQLHISNQMELTNEKERVEQEILDLKCLQLLRAMVHNEIVKLPDDFDSADTKELTRMGQSDLSRLIEVISQVQNSLNKHDAMLKVLPHLSKASDQIVREVLGFLANMLFNGNEEVQESLIDYFYNTREEKFFLAVKERMTLSSMAWKENRALLSQHQAKIEEAIAEMRDLQQAIKEGRVSAEAMQGNKLGSMLMSMQASRSSLRGSASRMRGSTAELRRRLQRAEGSMAQIRGSQASLHGQTSTQSAAAAGGSKDRLGNGQAVGLLPENRVAPVQPSNVGPPSAVDDADIEELAMRVVMENENLQMKDEGYIELVLRVLAYICDGQNTRLQDYLREQPDNIKSINLVAETSRFLGLTYTSINKSNISLIIQIFDTLVEFASGNLSNQAVCFDNKVCDYMNYLLRSKQSYAKFGLLDEMSMKRSIANLIIAMIEENVKRGSEPDPAELHDAAGSNTLSAEKQAKPAAGVADEVKDTMDAESIRNVFIDCYRRHLDEALSKESQEMIITVGFKYFHIFLRFRDLDKQSNFDFERMIEKDADAEEMRLIWDFYQSNTMSIEVLKDETLQKVYFRVKDPKVLREDVKELFKYEVDRSSPTNKLRDFSDWLREIIKDIKWQKRVLSNPLGSFFVHGWKAFNILCIILSLAISIVILVDWTKPDSVNNPVPVRTDAAVYATYVLGISHNILSLFVLISFFLSNNPYVPSPRQIRNFWSQLVGVAPKDAEEGEEEAGGKLQASVFSFSTFYYIIFLAFSILGTIFYGYFFAFHLLHIARHNQLLSRVIQAVTKNGLSLLWVLIYSLAFFFIYALLSFAFYRGIYDSSLGNYCETMYQCTVTVIHRGLIAGIYDYLSVPIGTSFTYHLVKAIFDISFFIIITTIGLNIIFGIIVDTFSELRDSKWQIDQDMTSVCFICSRNAYDFEHHGEGFEKHVKEEHNQWAYLFFILYLDETRFNDYTAIELYVWRLFENERLDYFPLNKSMTLEAAEDNREEAKLETLLSQVSYLVRKWKEEELSKERERERKRQQKWEEQHKKSGDKAALGRLVPPRPMTGKQKSNMGGDMIEAAFK